MVSLLGQLRARWQIPVAWAIQIVSSKKQGRMLLRPLVKGQFGVSA